MFVRRQVGMYVFTSVGMQVMYVGLGRHMSSMLSAFFLESKRLEVALYLWLWSCTKYMASNDSIHSPEKKKKHDVHEKTTGCNDKMIQNDPNSVKSTSAKCYLRSAMLKTPIGCSGKSCPHRNKSGSKPIGAPWAVRKVKKQIRRDMISMDPCNKMSAKIPKRLCEIICTPWKSLQRGEAHKQLPSAARNLSLSKKMVSSPQISLKDFTQGQKLWIPWFQSAKQLMYLPGFHGQRGSNSRSEPLVTYWRSFWAILAAGIFHDVWWLCKSQGLMENSNEKHRRKLQICKFHLPLNCWIGIYDLLLNGS